MILILLSWNPRVLSRLDGELELLAFQATFAKYDKNGDGGLTEEEWYEVMRDSGSDISR